jgi:hypothetical protein
MRADGSQVEELIRKLKDAKMDATISDEDAKKAAAAYASGTKVAVASVTDASGTETLDVRKDKDKNYYAKSSAVDGIYQDNRRPGRRASTKKVDDFRNKKLFDFGWTDPQQSGGRQADRRKERRKVDERRQANGCVFGAERGR